MAVSARFSFALAALALTQAPSAAVLRRLELGSQVASSKPTHLTRYSTFLPDLRSSRIASISHSCSSETIVPLAAAAGLSTSGPRAFALVQELHMSTSQPWQHHLVLPLWKSCSHPPSHVRSSSSLVVDVFVRGLLHSGHGTTELSAAAGFMGFRASMAANPRRVVGEKRGRFCPRGRTPQSVEGTRS